MNICVVYLLELQFIKLGRKTRMSHSDAHDRRTSKSFESSSPCGTLENF